MADTVRYLMEDMIPELEDLEQRGYFTRCEIKQIVKKRTDFEYLLKRRAALKADYLKYIQYESRLEELRRLRREAAGLAGTKKSLADHALVRRIHFIYERATRKFRGDLALWHGWLHFCKVSRSGRQMSKVLAKALQLHPSVAGLWSYAAAWEVEHNRNPAAARALMQRGLRLCKADTQLWVEYFRLELMYAHTLRARRKVLGIDAARGEEAAEAASQAEGGEGEREAAVEAVLSGKVAEVVFRNAAAALPRTVAVRRCFLDALQPFTFPGAASVAQVIYSSLEEDFPGNEEAWDLRARRHLGPHALPAASGDAALDPWDVAAGAFEAAIAALPTVRMYDAYVAFLAERLDELAPAESAAEWQVPRKLRGPAREAAAALLRVCERAAAEGAASQATLLAWPLLALRCGKPAAAMAAAVAATAAAPRAAPLWRQRLLLQAQQAVAQGGGEGAAMDQLEAVVRDAVRVVPAADGAELWELAFQTFLELGLPLQGLARELETLLTGLPRGPLQGGMGGAAATALAAVRTLHGLGEARAFYGRLLAQPSAGGALFHAVLDIELDAPAAERLRPGELRAIFEAAVDAYGNEDVDLWLRYARWEASRGQGLGKVHWRAIKALGDPQSFIDRVSAEHAAY